MPSKVSEIHVSTNTILKIVLTGLILWFLWVIRDILILVAVAVTLASALEPLVEKLRRKHIPRAVSVLTVYILAIALLVIIGYLFVRPVAGQIMQLAANPKTIADPLQQSLRSNIFSGLNIQKNVTAALQSIGSQMVTFQGSFFDRTVGVFNGVIDVITILVISFYLVADPSGMRNVIHTLVPAENRQFALHLVTRIQHKIGWWMIGQFIISFTVFALVLIGLTVLGVKYAFVLAILAGVLEFIPYIGPFLSAIPGIFFAFVQNPALAIPVAIMYLLVQKTEGYILVPKVMQKTIGASPLVVMLAIIIGLKVAGVFGLILAVPIVAAVIVVMEEWKPDAISPQPIAAEPLTENIK